VNCPALSAELMSSVLFGHKRGAFTGAVSDAAGKAQEAEGGTLFLDEVGDLTPDAQARLLRFLNDRTYERLGEAKERRADVRLVAATNRSLDDEMRAGRFREDLLFRLNVVTLTVPPLRERIDDALPLAHYYLGALGRRARREPLAFAAEAEQAILAHQWPGNLRELRNAIERAIILAPSAVITPLDLGIDEPPLTASPRAPSGPVLLGADVTLEELEREHIARIIARTATLDGAARILGIDPTTLQRKRKRYGLA